MWLRELQPQERHRCYVAIVDAGDDEVVQVEVELTDYGLALNDSVDAFTMRFPMRGRPLCGAIFDVVEGRKQLPVEF